MRDLMGRYLPLLLCLLTLAGCAGPAPSGDASSPDAAVSSGAASSSGTGSSSPAASSSGASSAAGDVSSSQAASSGDTSSPDTSSAEGPSPSGDASSPDGASTQDTPPPDTTPSPDTSGSGTSSPSTSPSSGTSTSDKSPSGGGASSSAPAYTDTVPVEDVKLEEETAALTDTPAALPAGFTPEASGSQEKRNEKAVIDYSNTRDGYVMARYTASTSQRLKVQVKGPTTTYTYNITAGEWTTFPLSDGNGSYQVAVYENVTGTKYSTVVSASFTASMTDEFAPFLRPNQYVDYSVAKNTVKKAKELTSGISDPLKKVEVIYNFVVRNITYDKDLASSVSSGYLPVLDKVLSKKSGICFDYAALMTGMLRSQGVPCKLVVGYAGSAYHAWISVWSKETGWVDGVIFFDGSAWQRMDPTFASSGNQSESIMSYIGDGANYSAKYFY